MTIINDYLKITREYSAIYGEKTLLLMQVGSFFESYALVCKDGTFTGSRIQEFADINDMTISRKNICVSGQSVVMAGFGLPQLEKYIKKMQEHGYTIVVYTQDIQSKNTTRSLSCIYSPGTFFSQESPESELSNNTACIWIHHSKASQVSPEALTIGIANLDIYTGRTSIYEFSTEFHHNPCTYDELEKHMAIYKPSETIIISNLSADIISNIIQFANIKSLQIHRINLVDEDGSGDQSTNNELKLAAENSEKQKYQDAVFNKFFKAGIGEDGAFISDYYKYCIATQAFCFLLEFVYKHNPNLLIKIEKPIVENSGDKLILANHSLKQLNIISDDRYTGKLGSVCSFLNNCITTIGRRQFNYDLLNPITNTTVLNKSYDITAHLLSENNWEYFRNSLANMRDLEKIKRKLMMKKISPKDFYNLQENLSSLKEIFANIKKDPVLLAYISSYMPSDTNFEDICKKLGGFLKKHFNLSKCRYLDEINGEKLGSLSLDNLSFINKNINAVLDKKSKACMDSQEVLEAVRKYFSDQVRVFEKSTKTGTTNEYIKIHETPKSDALLIGTKRRVSLLKNALAKITEIGQYSVEIKFTSKYTNTEEIYILNISKLEYKAHGGNQTNLIICSEQIRELASNIQTSKDSLVLEIIQFYKEIIENFSNLIERKGEKKGGDDLDIIINLIRQCDLLQCKCYIAHKYNYSRPTIVGDADADADADADVNENIKSFAKFEKLRHPLIEQLNTRELYVSNDLEIGSHINGILLYGTNAVGKTSLIKAMGITIIMAQAGLYVPCASLIYKPYNYIFTRILGNDNIFKNLSTFAVEMSELRTILKQSTPNSLILGDELCSGTESTSALSIFAAGVEKLHAVGASFIFATHFHEIAKYEEIRKLARLKFYHMTVVFNREKKQLIYDRKLKPGPGESMYGLEVCKSLDLPADFLDRAHSLRLKYAVSSQTGGPNLLLSKASHYNSKKIRDLCEICRENEGTEIHHLQHQENADNKGIIGGEFHKNHIANLINICGACHVKIHTGTGGSDAESGSDWRGHKIVKTSDGYEIMGI
jgi:DNA mismatch repair protein MutS